MKNSQNIENTKLKLYIVWNLVPAVIFCYIFKFC